LLFVVEKKCSVEVRSNFGTRSACAPKYSASAEHCKGHVRCISTLLGELRSLQAVSYSAPPPQSWWGGGSLPWGPSPRTQTSLSVLVHQVLLSSAEDFCDAFCVAEGMPASGTPALSVTYVPHIFWIKPCCSGVFRNPKGRSQQIVA